MEQRYKISWCYIVFAKIFSFNIQVSKQKHYRSINKILGEIGMNTTPAVLCSLINSFCVPVVMYATEAFSWSKRNLNSLDRVNSQAFHKVFRVFDNGVIRQCQYFMDAFP